MRLLSALCASVLALGGLVAVATPSFANGSCGSPVPMSGGSSLATATGNVSASNVQDVWSVAAFAGTYTVTLNSFSNDVLSATSGGCAVSYCYNSPTVGAQTCTFSVPAPSTLLVFVKYVSPGPVVSSAYTVTVVDQNASVPGCTNVAGVTACASYTATTPFQTLAVNAPGTTPVDVAGEIDAYAFTLPNGGVLTLPCVVVGTTDPCGAAGGRYVSRFTTLSRTVDVPTTALTTPVATVRVCNANLVLTVDEFGVNSFPAYTVC